MLSHFWEAYGSNLVLMLVVMTGVWVLAERKRDLSIIDLVWPVGFVLIAGVAAFRRDLNLMLPHYVVLVMVLVWAVRLEGHLYARWHAEGPDRRYDAFMKHAVGPKPLFTLVAVFWFQAFALWLVALPIQEVMLDPYPPLNAVGIAGNVLVIGGFLVETLADRQLRDFRHEEANAGQVMDRGLWRYSRHPNYFGEACVHWGFWLIAVANGTGWWTAIGPAFLTFTLLRMSGVPMVERHMLETRKGYADYKARTSAFVPWPPKKA